MKCATCVVLALLLLATRGSADTQPEPILRAELSNTIAVPGQAISLEITVLVPTWMPEPPELPSFELPGVMIRLPEGASRPAHEQVDGEYWSGVTRAYQLHPMRPGRFRIPPQTVRVVFADPEASAPVVAVMRTDAFEFEGRIPAGAEGLVPFLAASRLTLDEEIDGDPEDLRPGDAVTRIVRARIEGASPVFLPDLVRPVSGEGFAAYPKEPVYEQEVDGDLLSGVRIEAVTYVAERGGRGEIPSVRLRWWNLATSEIEVAELASVALLARGPLLGVDLSSVGPSEWGAWLSLAALLLVGSVLAFLRLREPLAAWWNLRRAKIGYSEANAFRQLERALRDRRLADALRVMDVWLARIGSPTGGARDAAWDALAPLGAGLYGRRISSPDPTLWAAARSALRALRRSLLARRRAAANEALPPLNPRSRQVETGFSTSPIGGARTHEEE